MSWHDFFYFSKGERNALILLLCLIAVAGIMLILTNSPSSDPAVATPVASPQTQPNAAVSASDSHTEAISSEASPVSSGQSASSPVSSRRQSPQGESTPNRINRLTSSPSSYPRTEKFAAGTIVELNSADTTTLKKVPGIGSAFANRIVRYRDLLGGYHTVQQLAEVYGIDEERYTAFAPWFTADESFIRKLPVNALPQDSLSRHPYISYRQARAIVQLRTQKKQLSGWENLALLDEFTELDKNRILPYLSFE
jgi:DNA uptake protein ComE-like DNA-binding protein